MKNAYIFFYGLMLALLTGVPSGCEDFVEVDLPNNQLTATAVFEDRSTATAAMVNVYSKIRDNGLLTGKATGLSHQLGNYADELVYFGNPENSSFDFYKNALVASHLELTELWNSSYSQIYGVNAVIEGVANSSALAQANKDQLTGEALFVRGLIHFYLVNTYGDVPYITTTDYQANSRVSRLPESEVYDKVIADLNDAILLLDEEYITDERVRPNRATAHALLARVYLYNGAWAAAANEASAVINTTDLYAMESLENVFLKSSMETIWQLSPGNDGDNTEEGSTFLFTSGPPPLSALSGNLLAAFTLGDQRREQWIGSVTDGTDTWHFPNKYKLTLLDGGSQEYSIVFRLAEMYLIRAEARAREGFVSGAIEDLNVVRQRAGLEDTTATTADEIIDAIMAERRLELFTEFGHRFFDLKRTGRLDAVLETVKPGWDANDVLLPIPEAELMLNPNLAPQNPGY